MAREAILHLADMTVEVQGLQDLDGTYINDATLTVTLKDTAGTLITGQTYPASMSYVSASNGNYRGPISDSINVSPGDLLEAWIDISTPSNGDRLIKLPCKVLKDTGIL